jgi:3-phenylpropionate/trans-cinnamate dioxygenase ferredoxin reductase subunit
VLHGGRRIRVEHWDVAFNQGRTVAMGMLGKGGAYDVVPYFFSDLSDWASIEYLGPAFDWDQEVIRGSLDSGAFTVFYLNRGRLAGALSVGRPEDLLPARRLIADRSELGERAAKLADLSSDLDEL